MTLAAPSHEKSSNFAMSPPVCAAHRLSFGTAPSSLMVVPNGPPIMVSGLLRANIPDNAPMVNVMPFGMCSSMANPIVASATADGVVTLQAKFGEGFKNADIVDGVESPPSL